jgi:RNA polymerase sigma factor (sigma-70 family)
LRAVKQYDDKEILKGILNGDDDIIRYVYKSSYKSIRHLVISNNGSEEDAQDVFQETIVILFRKIREEKFILTSSLNTFLYSIGRILWLKELGKRKKYTELDHSEEYIDLDDDIDVLISLNDRLKLYREKFEELSEDCKKVLRMFLEEISIKEITRAMGYSSEQHTKNRRFRCKKSLIKKIQNSKEYKELRNETVKNDRSIPRW